MISIYVLRGLERDVICSVVFLVGGRLGQYWLWLMEDSKIMAVKHCHSIAHCWNDEYKSKHGHDCTDSNVLGSKEFLKS